MKLNILKIGSYLICKIKRYQFQFDFRAIDIQALIGTVGGYLGLFLGYSMLQIPIMMTLLIKRINNWFSEKLSRSENIVDIHRSTINSEKIKSRIPLPEYRDNSRQLDHNATSLQLMIQETLERELDSKIRVIMEEKRYDMMNYIDHSIERKIRKL